MMGPRKKPPSLLRPSPIFLNASTSCSNVSPCSTVGRNSVGWLAEGRDSRQRDVVGQGTANGHALLYTRGRGPN